MGNEASHEENIAANVRLEAELRTLETPVRPLHVFSSGSEDPETGWGEPGFNVLFAEDTPAIEQAMRQLGVRFGQAAIYRYRINREAGTTVQSVVPCADSGLEGVSSEVELAFLKERTH